MREKRQSWKMDSYQELIRENICCDHFVRERPCDTTQIKNMKRHLLAVLNNAPVTIERHYAAQVNYDLYSG